MQLRETVLADIIGDTEVGIVIRQLVVKKSVLEKRYRNGVETV